MKPNHAIVADGHALHRAGIAAVLGTTLDVETILQADRYTQVRELVEQNSGSGLLTIDLSLQGLNGLAGLRQLRTTYPDLLILVITASDHRESVLGALSAGVHGYLAKDAPAPELANAFKVVMKGRIYVPSSVTEVLTLPLMDRHGEAGAQNVSKLTDRQSEVLRLVAAGESNKQIARILRIAEGTVKVHVAAAFRTLGVHNRVSAAAALRRGSAAAYSQRPPRFGSTMSAMRG